MTVAQGPKNTQLQVTISSKVTNIFAGSHRLVSRPPPSPGPRSPTSTGLRRWAAPATRLALSPGTSGAGPTNSQLASAAGCVSDPQFWATIEGPATQKIQGDRYSTRNCAGSEDGCRNNPSPTNTDYRTDGYNYVVRVKPDAKQATPTLDRSPCSCMTRRTCTRGQRAMSCQAADGPTTTIRLPLAAMRPIAVDNAAGSSAPATTTQARRRQWNAAHGHHLRPEVPHSDARPNSGDASGQFLRQAVPRLHVGATAATLRQGNGSYNIDLARVFHQWEHALHDQQLGSGRLSTCRCGPTHRCQAPLQLRRGVAAPPTRRRATRQAAATTRWHSRLLVNHPVG